MEHELIYTSRARQVMRDEDLTALLKQSCEKNVRLGITGLLLYFKGEFVQLLEGEKSAIFSLYETILLDDRHQQVHLVWDDEIESRGFSNWSMAFININAIEPDALQAYSAYLQDGVAVLHRTDYATIGKRLIMGIRDDFLSPDIAA